MTESVAELELMSKADPENALKVLAQLETSPSFYPWYSLLRARIFASNKEGDDAARELYKLLERNPDFPAGWALLLEVSRELDRYVQVSGHFIKKIGSFKLDDPQPWLLRAYFEAALASGATPYERPELFKVCAAIAVARDAMGFCAELKRAVEASSKGFAGWKFECNAAGPVLRVSDDVATVNLSRLRIPEIEEWTQLDATYLLAAIRALLNWCPYEDDEGIGMWPRVRDHDHPQLVLWQLITGVINSRRDDSIAIKKASVNKYKMETGELYIRAGSVELWALGSFLENPIRTLNAAESVSLLAERCSAIDDGHYKEPVVPWWPRLEAETNIQRLHTNAGWYARAKFAKSSFSDWATRYANALTASKLVHCVNPHLLPYVSKLNLSQQKPSTISEIDILTLLTSQKVVFVTPFADLLNAKQASGGLRRFWEAIGYHEATDVKFVQAPMSIWPYYPNESWSLSFEELLRNCVSAVIDRDATVFIAACGCYGAPICHSIHQKFQITSLYIGHIIHMYFGLVTGAFLNDSFYTKHISNPYWDQGDLVARFTHIGRVDDGRYA